MCVDSVGKVDISDELKSVIQSVEGYEDKVRVCTHMLMHMHTCTCTCSPAM